MSNDEKEDFQDICHINANRKLLFDVRQIVDGKLVELVNEEYLNKLNILE